MLGPLLFLLYVNDIASAVPELNVKLFADDTNLFVTNKDPFLLNIIANEAVNSLNVWFLANKLSLNVDKTCYMVFTPRRSDCNINFKLSIGGIEIERVKSCRYLGLIIDDELKWSDHINNIYSYLLKYVGIFYKLRNRVPADVMKNVYYAFVHSHILYGIELYANTFPTYIDKLVKLNNRILRILLHQSRFCSVRDLYTSFNTLSVPDLHKYQILLLVHNTLFHSNLLPDVFANYFTLNSSVHVYLTRSHSDIHIYRANTSFGQRSVTHKGGILWNSLPSALKSIHSTTHFKSKLLQLCQTIF